MTRIAYRFGRRWKAISLGPKVGAVLAVGGGRWRMIALPEGLESVLRQRRTHREPLELELRGAPADIPHDLQDREATELDEFVSLDRE